jgi:hypothetical protein
MPSRIDPGRFLIGVEKKQQPLIAHKVLRLHSKRHSLNHATAPKFGRRRGKKLHDTKGLHE